MFLAPWTFLLPVGFVTNHGLVATILFYCLACSCRFVKVFFANIVIIFLHYTHFYTIQYQEMFTHIKVCIYQVQSVRLVVMFLVQGPQWDAAKWWGVVIAGIESSLTPCSWAKEGTWGVRRFTSLSSQSISAQQGVTLDVCMSANISQERWVRKNRGRASRTQAQLSLFISLTPKSIVKLSLDSAT